MAASQLKGESLLPYLSGLLLVFVAKEAVEEGKLEGILGKVVV